jgi:hypothetical protein
MSAKVQSEKKAGSSKAEPKAAFDEMCRGMLSGLMSGEPPDCCRPVMQMPMMQMMMSRWASAFTASKQP